MSNWTEAELKEIIAALEEASSKVKIEGARYSEFHQKLVGR
jgi:hypothetical protein